ncbi:Dot/Icm T4SS effector Ceg17 [Legionella nagasakiensis]|uniref:Dot/Icm T4SS effector Ceg17 n=1 Tax=Legionella nagasakiensis TaxID=535290 RepID=UPI001A93C178|nr:Dot/Icm T4SS effector Ceg17 [Legionella nagasakiensis]
MPLTDTGYVLQYTGLRFTDDLFTLDKKYIDPDTSLSPFQAFVERFSNLGALVIRNHLSHGKRAGLLQQIARIDYTTNPVERPAEGRDETGLFFREKMGGRPMHASVTATQTYEHNAHCTLGQSKVLNTRAQPLIHVNSRGYYGEQGIWDIIHSPVWNVGRSMQFELKNQGFKYVACPVGTTPEQRALLDHAIRTYHQLDGTTLRLDDHSELFTADIPTLDIITDDKKTYTSESNGLAIRVKFSGAPMDPAPLGWIIHEATGEILPQDITEDIIRVTAISKGEFYKRTKAQQAILQAGRLSNTSGLGLFIQNQAFNAMYHIFDHLQKYDFDPRPMLDGTLSAMKNRLKERLEREPDVIDDLLTGALLNELVEPLHVTRSRSERETLPIRFTNSSHICCNNLKAIAYAFDLKDCEGAILFKAYDDTPLVEPSPTMIDVKLNGELATPSFNTGMHVSAVLSTADLVAEQMILEQLLARSLESEAPIESSDLYKLCIDVLEDEEKARTLVTQLMELARTIVVYGKNPDAPKLALGLQYSYCQDLVTLLREGLGLEQLARISCLFGFPGKSTQEVMDEMSQGDQEKLQKMLKALYKIGNHLQSSPSTSVEAEHAHGINTGIIPLIEHLCPSLIPELHGIMSLRPKASVPAATLENMHRRLSTQDFMKGCPFLAHRRKESSAPVVTPESSTYTYTAEIAQLLGGIGHFLWENKTHIAVAAGAIAANYLM